ASPQDPIATRGVGYPIADELDLRAYAGFNYESLISKLEQRLDGPEPEQRLPGLGADTSLGVMRSKKPGSTDQARILTPLAVQTAPRVDRTSRLERDVRSKLTTVSGEGLGSPVPVISTARDAGNNLIYGSQFSNRKVRLNELIVKNDDATAKDVNHTAVKRAF